MKKINHLGIIVDGNGRWAKERGLSRSEGHKAGAEALRKIILYLSHEKLVNYLSLYVFSTENFGRPADEVNYLMELFLKKCSENHILTEMDAIIADYKKEIPQNEQMTLF